MIGKNNIWLFNTQQPEWTGCHAPAWLDLGDVYYIKYDNEDHCPLLKFYNFKEKKIALMKFESFDEANKFTKFLIKNSDDLL